MRILSKNWQKFSQKICIFQFFQFSRGRRADRRRRWRERTGLTSFGKRPHRFGVGRQHFDQRLKNLSCVSREGFPQAIMHNKVNNNTNTWWKLISYPMGNCKKIYYFLFSLSVNYFLKPYFHFFQNQRHSYKLLWLWPNFFAKNFLIF